MGTNEPLNRDGNFARRIPDQLATGAVEEFYPWVVPVPNPQFNQVGHGTVPELISPAQLHQSPPVLNPNQAEDLPATSPRSQTSHHLSNSPGCAAGRCSTKRPPSSPGVAAPQSSPGRSFVLPKPRHSSVLPGRDASAPTSPQATMRRRLLIPRPLTPRP
jgi:hypothetical protein